MAALLAALVAILLLLGAAVLVLAGGRGDRRLRARLQEIQPGAAPVAAQPTASSIRLASAEDRGHGERLLARLGRDPHVPPAMALSLPVLLSACGGAGLVVAWQAAGLLGSGPGLLAGPAVAGLLLKLAFGWEKARHRDAVFRQIPDAIGLIVRGIRAGLPMAEALRSVAQETPSPTREHFARAVGEIAIGRPVDSALWQIHLRTGLTEYAFFAVTLGLQSQTGGSLAETLENLGDIVRKRVALAGKAKAMSSEARMSAGILVAMPVLCGAGLTLLVPGHLDPMFETELGRMMLSAGIGLLLTGLLVIRALIRSAVKD